MEAKYIRVVASSILALGHVISVASDDVNTNMETEYAILFKQNKFWKFARHKSPNVWYFQLNANPFWITVDICKQSLWVRAVPFTTFLVANARNVSFCCLPFQLLPQYPNTVSPRSSCLYFHLSSSSFLCGSGCLPSVCLSLLGRSRLSVFLSIRLPVCPSLFAFPSTGLSFSQFVCLSFRLPVSVCPPVCLFILLLVCVCPCLRSRMSVFLSVCLPVFPSARLCLRPRLPLFILLPVCVRLCLRSRLSVFLSICLPILPCCPSSFAFPSARFSPESYGSHSQIRAAIFSLVGTSGQRLPGLLNSFASSACPALFSALDNTEPVVCQQLWAGVLSVVQHVQVRLRVRLYPSVCLSLFVCFSVHSYLCLFVYLFMYVCLSFSSPTMSLSVRPSISVAVLLSVRWFEISPFRNFAGTKYRLNRP